MAITITAGRVTGSASTAVSVSVSAVTATGLGGTPAPFMAGLSVADASTTGLTDVTALTLHDGDLTLTAAGTYKDLDVAGFLTIDGADIHVKNFRVRARNTTFKGAGVVMFTANADGSSIENSEISSFYNGADNSRYWLNGVSFVAGAPITIRRNDIHDVVDAINGVGDDITIQSNWCHDFTFRSDDADHASDSLNPYWTHNDGFQCKGGDNILVEGNNFVGMFSPDSGMIADPDATGSHGVPDAGEWPNMHGILINPTSATCTNFRSRRNRFSGCTYLVQIASSGSHPTGNSGTFYQDTWYVGQTGYSTQSPAQAVYDTSVGTFTGWDTIIYAADDMNVSAAWRGHTIQSPTGSYTYRYNPALTP